MKKIQLNLVLASALTVFAMTQASHAFVIQEHKVGGMSSEDLEKIWMPEGMDKEASKEESKESRGPATDKGKEETLPVVTHEIIKRTHEDQKKVEVKGDAGQTKQSKGKGQNSDQSKQSKSSSTPMPVSTPIPVPTTVPVPLPSDLPIVLPSVKPEGKTGQTKQGKTQTLKIDLSESQKVKDQIKQKCGEGAIPVMDPSPVGPGIGGVASNPELRITFPFGTEDCGEKVVADFVKGKKVESKTPQSNDRKFPKDLSISQEQMNTVKEQNKVKKAD